MGTSLMLIFKLEILVVISGQNANPFSSNIIDLKISLLKTL
jgi:hypothetical protein